MKLTDKQCRFADAVSAGINPTVAYRDIYNIKSDRLATANEASSRLMRNSKVKARIEAVTEAAEARIASEIVFDKKRIISELALNMELGRETKQLAASNQAIKLIGSAVGNVFEPEAIAVSGTVELLHKLPDAVLEQLAAMSDSESIESIDTGSEAAIVEASYSVIEAETEP